MAKAPPHIKITRGRQDKLIVERDKKKIELTFQQAFSFGHSYLQAGHYHQAEDVFSALAEINGRGPKIMLARCKAEVEGFDACNDILHAIFAGENEPIAGKLQGAFVFHTMCMRDDAIREMVEFVQRHPDFPIAFLYLGDLYLENGDYNKAAHCWKLAVKQDRRGGAVAVAARKQLAQLVKLARKEKETNNKPTTRNTPRKRQ